MAEERRDRVTRRGLAKGAALAAGAFAVKAEPAAATPRDRHAPRPWRPDDDDDIALVNGNFITLNPRDSKVTSVAIRGNRIVDVGRGRSVRSCKRTIDLRGATVIPGLIDSHQHFIRACHNPGHEVRAIEAATTVAELQSARARPHAGRADRRVHHLHRRLEPQRPGREAAAHAGRAGRGGAAAPRLSVGDQRRQPGRHQHGGQGVLHRGRRGRRPDDRRAAAGPARTALNRHPDAGQPAAGHAGGDRLGVLARDDRHRRPGRHPVRRLEGRRHPVAGRRPGHPPAPVLQRQRRDRAEHVPDVRAEQPQQARRRRLRVLGVGERVPGAVADAGCSSARRAGRSRCTR